MRTKTRGIIAALSRISRLGSPTCGCALRGIRRADLRRLANCTAIAAKGTVAARKGRAEATTIRLMAVLRILAGKASNYTPIGSGKRNSAPPRPINGMARRKLPSSKHAGAFMCGTGIGILGGLCLMKVFGARSRGCRKRCEVSWPELGGDRVRPRHLTLL